MQVRACRSDLLNFCTDSQNTIFELEKQSSEKAVRVMLNCLKNSKDSWFRVFKEALKITGEFAS